jgi:hypothetical protein
MRKSKKVAITTVSVALALSLTSCYGAGPNAATRMINRVTDGNEVNIIEDGSNLRVVNLLLVATEDGSAVLVGTFNNRAEATDQILGIAVGSSQAVITGETKLYTNKPVHFEGESANAKALFPGVNPVAGTTVDLTIGFARAGLVKVKAIIRDKRDIYANVTSGSKLATPAASPTK